MQDSEKFRKYNIVAKGIIDKRSKEFKDIWKKYKYIYQKERNQRNYGEQLMKEASKLDNFHVPLKYLN